MSSENIIHHMACDISQWITVIVPNWPYPNEPAEEYFDAIRAAFGEAPTEASVIAAYKSGDAAAAMQRSLNQDLETDLVSPKIAKQLTERVIINNFGRDALA
ncbi:hypothetical protein AB1L30_03040 [Bremerella sp. JC817]|uniref:hypothetical protein n=1 Tax=Bremerella sp. JC817 TaxID=3231756 RepID=UPI00345AE5D1